jgi:hypothetical protein
MIDFSKIDPQNCYMVNPTEGTHKDGWMDISPYDYNKDCSGCVYEDADGSTTAISNCVCCSRNVDFAKNDYYKKKKV